MAKGPDSSGINADVDLDISISDAGVTGDCPEIWIDPQVKQHIKSFASTDTSRELGGVLLGELQEHDGRPSVRILAAIDAKYTEAVSTSVKFTHETWDDIHRVKDEKYPDMRIVGWFHTHPSFGVFLSRWDMFIQENFYNLPWQVAYVVDPVNRTEGFFRWEGGKVVEVGREKKQVFAPAEVRLDDDSKASTAPKRHGWGTWAAAIAIIGLAGAVAYLSFFRPPQVRVIRKVVERRIPVSVPAQSVSKASAAYWKEYYVRSGDSLWRIAADEYGNGAYVKAICVFNGIDDRSRLFVGKKLDLPCREVADRLCGR